MKNVPSYKYMTNFQCTGPDCIDTCCRGWEIYVSKGEKKKIDKSLHLIPEYEISPKDIFQRNRQAKSELEMYKINVNTSNKLCGLYESSGLCMIHKYLGETYLPLVCSTYPKSLALINDDYELSGSLSCPEVARLCLLDKDAFSKGTRSIDMATTQTIAELKTDKYIHTITRNIVILRDMFTSFMKIDGIDYKSRLFLAVYFAFKIKDCETDEELINTATKFTSPEYMNEIIQQFSLLPTPEKKFSLLFINSILLAGRVTATGNSVLFDLIQEILDGFGGEDAEVSKVNEFYVDRHNGLSDKELELLGLALTNYALNFLTRSYLISYNSVPEYFYEMLMLLATLKFLIVCHPRLGSDTFEDIIVDTGYRLSRTYEHNVAYLTHIRETVKENEFLTLAHLANLIML